MTTDRDIERTPCENGGRDWNNECISQQIPKIASKLSEIKR